MSVIIIFQDIRSRIRALTRDNTIQVVAKDQF